MTPSPTMDAGSAETARRDAGNTQTKAFVLSSPSFRDGGELPAESSGCEDGEAGSSPELKWTAGPKGTVAYALVMRQVDSEEPVYSWAVVNIPADETMLEAGLPATGVGVVTGTRQLRNSSMRRQYAVPCNDEPSKYELKLYALSAEVSSRTIDVAVFVNTIAQNDDLVLDEATLTVTTSP